MRTSPIRRTLTLIATAVVIAALAPRVAHADATVTLHSLTCTSFTASGTSTSPYVTIYAENTITSAYWWAIVPVVGGSYATTLTFPTAQAGTPFNLEVWGTLNLYTHFGDSGYYDGGPYFDATENIHLCSNIPLLGFAGLAILATLLGLAGWFAIRRLAP